MDKKKYSITIEFTEKSFMNDFIDLIKDEDWNTYIEYKIIKNKPEYLNEMENILFELKKIIEKIDS